MRRRGREERGKGCVMDVGGDGCPWMYSELTMGHWVM